MATRDGSGNILSFETRTYGAAASTTSGLPQHGTANVANSTLTSDNVWVNTDGSYISTAYQTDDAGTVTAISTPYVGSTASKWRTTGHDATDTFSTSTTEPATTSGVTLSSSAGFDVSSGVPTVSADYNNQPTYLKAYDWLGRPGEVDAPDGGQVTYTYTPTSRVTVTKVDGSRTVSLVEASDELGRPSRVALGSGQGAAP